MFSRISRYRHLPDVVATDAKGRVQASKSLRLLPAVSGDFSHTVEESDRLDHLAYKYYKQPRDWWRIADANPEFLSPQALLGKEPNTRVQIPLTWEGLAPPWSELLQAVLQRPGVDEAIMGTADQAFAEVEIVQGPLIFTIDPALSAELDASGRAQAITPPLETALLAEGVTFTNGVRLAKPDAATWHIIDLQTRQVYTFQLLEGSLNVYDSATRYHWVVTVTYNTVKVATGDILGLVEDLGFAAGPPVELGRIGKAIVVPPRKARA